MVTSDLINGDIHLASAGGKHILQGTPVFAAGAVPVAVARRDARLAPSSPIFLPIPKLQRSALAKNRIKCSRTVAESVVLRPIQVSIFFLRRVRKRMVTR